MQYYSALGAPEGGNIEVDSGGKASEPSAAARDDGGLIVAWTRKKEDNSTDVVAQVYGADGSKKGTEIEVNTFNADWQQAASVATLDDSHFVIVWESWQQDGEAEGVFGQRFDSAGEKTGDEFLVNKYTDAAQKSPKVCSFADGSFLVIWESCPHIPFGPSQDGSNCGVFAQRFDKEGNRIYH